MTITLTEVLAETDLVADLLGMPRQLKYVDIVDATNNACEVCGALGAIYYCAACGSEQDARELPKLRKLLTEPTIFDDLRSEVIAEPITESVLPKRITPNKWMRGPFQAPEMAQPVVEAPDGYRDSYFAAADRSVTDRVAAAVNDLLAKRVDDADLIDGATFHNLRTDPFSDPATINKWNVTKGDKTTEDLVAEAEAEQSTDADRRNRMAEQFGINPATLTDDRLDPDNWKDN